ncbi:MAG: type II toxin-antitoxin system VapC family toxin [Deltaproteobacteria bacterium]|nr:type II toxin-antitoxin system VapC family toxin [Deltaproteobacteria bacterium]
MSTRFLLDTNALSEPLKPRPSARVLELLTAHADSIATASPVWHELVFGVASMPPGRRRRTGERYLQNVIAANVPIVGYDAAAASWHAHERARLAAAGKPAPFVDGQIAAVAAVNGLTLVTANARDFACFHAVRVTSWH